MTVTSRDVALRLGRAMCEAYGLDPSHVSRITVTWEPHALPYATVDLFLSEQAVRQVLHLRPVEAGDDAAP